MKINDYAHFGVDEFKDIRESIKLLLNGEPDFVIVESGKFVNTTSELKRKMAKQELNKETVAIAIVQTSLMVKFLTNSYLFIDKPVTPTKLFSNYENALNWLRKKKETFFFEVNKTEKSLLNDVEFSQHITKTSVATHKLIEDDIIYIKINEHAEYGMDELKESLETNRILNKDRDFCILVEDSPYTNYSIEVRRASKLKRYTKGRIAMAIYNPDFKMNFFSWLYFKYNKPEYPIKPFRSKNDAIIWLREQRDNYYL